MNNLKNKATILTKNIYQLKNNLTNVNDKINSFGKFIKTVIDMLEIPNEVERKLSKLDNMLFHLDQLLLVVSIIPPISNGAKHLRIIVSSLKNITHSQKNKIEKINNGYIEPIRDKISNFHGRIQYTNEEINNFCKILNTFRHKFNKNIELIKNIKINNKMNYQSKLIALNLVYDECTFSVSTMNNMLNIIIKSIDKINYQLKRVKNRCIKLKTISNDINKVIKKLNYINKVICPLSNILDKKVVISYNMKVKVKKLKKKKIKKWKSSTKFIWNTVTVWEWKWELKTIAITFTINQILNDIDIAMNSIKKKIN